MIIVSSGWGSKTITAGISDTAGNTYATSIGPIAHNGGIRGQIWYAKNIVGGANTVTVTYSSSIAADIEIHEYSGLDAVAPYDTSGSATGTSDSVTNPSIASGLVPTNLTNELIFGYTVGGSGATAAGSGFKQRQVVSNDLSEDKVVAASGLYQTTFTQTSGNSSWVALMATFKSGASTGETLMASSTASTATGRIKLRLSAGAAQPAGTYTNLITYTIYAAY